MFSSDGGSPPPITIEGDIERPGVFAALSAILLPADDVGQRRVGEPTDPSHSDEAAA